jgi:RNA-directed DNA polymerase
MADQPRTRQEIYDRIKQSSKETVILEDMIRLGFWTEKQATTPESAKDLKRIQELQKELAQKTQEQARYQNKEAFLRDMRQKRMEASKKKRLESKQQREKERQERAAAWRQKKERDIIYLGERVSGYIQKRETNAANLQQRGLPILENAADVAKGMGITVNTLRFLAYDRKTSTISHYKRFTLPKKTGGTRLISAPMPKLKAAQYWVLHNILEKVETHQNAHGFIAKRSIITNAQPHLGSDILVNIDLKDFFPTLSFMRVKGLFRSFGYSESISALLTLICTEADTEEVILDGQRYFIALSERRLPQGAPSSPAITNLICRRMDRRFEKFATKLGFTYTRYADDLTFSAKGEATKKLCTVLRNLAPILTHEGFIIHPDKTRVLRKSQRQEVTGLIVNEKLGVPRDTLRKFRAALFQIEKDGPAGKKWGSTPDVIAAIKGFAEFVAMVNPEQGKKYKEQVARIIATHGWNPPPNPFLKKAKETAAQSKQAETNQSAAPSSNDPNQPKKKWWKLW